MVERKKLFGLTVAASTSLYLAVSFLAGMGKDYCYGLTHDSLQAATSLYGTTTLSTPAGSYTFFDANKPVTLVNNRCTSHSGESLDLLGYAQLGLSRLGQKQ